MLEIPINPQLPKQRVTVTLDDVVLTFRLAWNTVTESWYMSVEDSAGEPIITGERVTVLTMPLAASKMRSVFPESSGVVCLGLGTENVKRDPGRFDLGASHRLVYISKADIDELAGEGA